MATIEGCAAMSDQFGNLVLYSDGSTVYNWQHLAMANGTGLFGNSSSTQSAIILKKPGSGQIYYVFSQQGPNVASGGCYYSIVDMSLASGSGSVVTKNVSMYQPSTEKLVATKHCNGIDYWIITRDANTGSFRCYLLTSAGVSAAVVTSPALSAVSGFNGAVGYLKVSPNGRKLANCAWVSNSAYDIYDFDNSTGLISNPMQLVLGGNNLAYSCEFSPDGTKFYGGNYSPASVYQWDLCAGSPSAIAASSLLLSSSSATSASKGAYQLGPDGKIYISRISQGTLAVINNPNLLGTSCGYVEQGFSISPKVCSYGLPNVITSGLKPPIPPFTHTVSNSFGCQTASFTPPNILQNYTVVSCVASGYSLTGMQWNFGDPASGASNTSTLQSPAHAFTNLGTYSVSLVVNFSCGGGTDTLWQVVNINQPCISVASTSITCSNLGSATVTASGGTGPYSYTWMPGAQTSSVANGLSPGAYTITVFDFGNNFTYTAQTIFTSLIPLTASISTSSSITCFGASNGSGQVSNLAGGSGNQTFLWTNGVVTRTTATTNSLSAGIWSVNVTDALTGCQINQSFFISQPPALNLLMGSSVPSVCVGGTVALNGITSGGTPFQLGPAYSYTWNNSANTNTNIASQFLAGNYTYTLITKDSLNCVTSNTVAVNFVGTPTLTVNNVSICPLATGTLVANGASTYTWNGVSTGANFSANPNIITQYTVVGSALGCTAATTASIILLPVPTAVILSNSPRCENTALNLNGSGGSMYKWSGPASFNSLLPFNTISQVGFNHAGVYNLTVTAVNGCTASTNATVVVNPIPTVAVTAGTVCTTQTLNLNCSSNANVFFWNGPLSFTSSVQNPFISMPVTGASGNYIALVTSAFGCTNQAVANALVLSPPTLSLSLSSPTLCFQDFNGSPNSIQLSYAGASSYNLQSSFLTFPALTGAPVNCTATPPYNNFYTTGSGTLEGSNGICSSFKSFTFVIRPNPSVTLSPLSSAICAGGQQTLNASGANNYFWTASAPQFTVMNGGTALQVKPNSSSNYSVYGSMNGCNSATETSTLVVNALPVFTLSPTNQSICLNTSIVLKAQGTGSTYEWTPVVGLKNPYGATVIASPVTSQNYTVVATVNNCTSTASIYLHVLSLPVPTIAVQKDKVCLDEFLHFTGFGGKDYEWRGPGDSYYQGQFLDLKAASSSFGGQYTLTVTDEKSCKNSTVVSVQILPKPIGALVNFKNEACEPYCGTYSFAANETPGAAKFLTNWEINKMKFQGSQFSYCFPEAGTYTINGKITDPNTTCENQIQYQLFVRPKPEADFSYNPERPIELLDDVHFTNISVGEHQNSWTWIFSDNAAENRKSESASYLYREAGTYPVALIVGNWYGCSDTVVKAVVVDPDGSIFVPNAFTPNGDENNDVFSPVIRSYQYYYLVIYDRWGHEIYQSNTNSGGWDGTFNGKACKQDVYNWTLDVVTIRGERKVKSGTVTLLR